MDLAIYVSGRFIRDCWYLVPQNALHYPWSCLPQQSGLFRPTDCLGDLSRANMPIEMYFEWGIWVAVRSVAFGI